MTEPLDDTWHSRDLPVLREVARQLELQDPMYGGGVRVHEVAEALDLDPETVHRSARILQDAGLLDARWVHPATHGRITQISTRARQLVGQWPSEETAADRLLAALEAIAEHGSDAPTRGRARSALEQLGGFSRDTLAAIAATVITGQIPGAAS